MGNNCEQILPTGKDLIDHDIVASTLSTYMYVTTGLRLAGLAHLPASIRFGSWHAASRPQPF
jgi:hypothetical protein